MSRPPIFSLLFVLVLSSGALASQHSELTPDAGEFCDGVTQIPQIECEALIAFYNSTNGPEWINNSNWLITATPCDWFGTYCVAGHVVGIYFWNNNIQGTLPPELDNLTNLHQLHLCYNQLTGRIPQELGNLANLNSLLLCNNQLTGSIPPELGNLTNLVSLGLSDIQLTGSIPRELGNLTNLTGLALVGNQLTGSIPPELGNLTNLEYLTISHNQLTGGIPLELGNLTNLEYLSISHNQLTGSMQLSLMGVPLETLAFSDTQLCEHQRADFQAWLASIPFVSSSGLSCPLPDNFSYFPIMTHP